MRLRLADLSIEWKVPLMVSGMLLLVAAALAIATYVQVRDSARTAAGARLRTVVDQFATSLAAQVPRFVQEAATAAARADSVGILRANRAPDRERLLETVRAGFADPDVVVLELLDSGGRRLQAVGPLAAGVGAIPVVRATATVGALRAIGNTLVFPVFARLGPGSMVLWRRVPGSAAARSAAGRLIGSDAALMLGSPGGAWSNQEHIVPAPPLNAADPGRIVFYHRPGVPPHMGLARAVPNTEWMVWLEFAEPAVLAASDVFLERLGLIALVVLTLGILGAWRLSRHVTGPLHDLTVAADAIGGDQTRLVPVNRGDELGRLAAAFNRMSARITEATAARRESEDEWRLLFDRNPSPMWVVDLESLRFLAVNAAAERLYGYSRQEFAALTIKDIRPAEDVGRLMEDLAEQKAGLSEPALWRHRRKDGGIMNVEITAHSLSFRGRPARIVLAQDLTARMALEAQLRQAQKMEAIGSLSAGIAHDFNNLLSVITTYTELARADLPAGDPRAQDMNHVLEASMRAHGLTRQLLAFSRQQVLAPVEIEPNRIVEGIVKLLQRVIGEDIALRTVLRPDIGHVRVDPGQFEQVLMNLAVNARDAMPTGGTLTVSTDTVELDDFGGRLHGLNEGGRFVTIAITDTGCGMSAETQARIFEPFFTTKEIGKGTGLGLATVYGILQQSGGQVTVYSEIGRGTTFRVYLPWEAATSEPDEARSMQNQTLPRGTETVLLAEDDAAVRNVTAEALKRLGYRVMPANGAEEALAIAARHKSPLDLVISDVIMPGASGPELIRQLRAVRPALKVLLLSGYTGDKLLQGDVGPMKLPFLGKPFTMMVLARKVREVLDAGAG